MQVTKGFRRVPQFEDAFQELWKKEPARAPGAPEEVVDWETSARFRPVTQMEVIQLLLEQDAKDSNVEALHDVQVCSS